MGRVVAEEEVIQAFGRGGRGTRRVVFTNGCFDLFHPGHVRSLERARSLGDVLIVGLNNDGSVRGLKGVPRPLLPEKERGRLLAAMEAVDCVVLFAQPTPHELIRRLLPDVLVKGGDWEHDAIVGRAEVEAAGGKVVSISLVPDYSTTALFDKILATAPKVSGQFTR